jgi:hypothetical protein
MILKSLIGMAIGAGCGYGYHVLMRCVGST